MSFPLTGKLRNGKHKPQIFSTDRGFSLKIQQAPGTAVSAPLKRIPVGIFALRHNWPLKQGVFEEINICIFESDTGLFQGAWLEVYGDVGKPLVIGLRWSWMAQSLCFSLALLHPEAGTDPKLCLQPAFAIPPQSHQHKEHSGVGISPHRSQTWPALG